MKDNEAITPHLSAEAVAPAPLAPHRSSFSTDKAILRSEPHTSFGPTNCHPEYLLMLQPCAANAILHSP
jgi:hypothetical protein